MFFRCYIREAVCSFRRLTLFVESSILLLIVLFFLSYFYDMKSFFVAETLSQEQEAREKNDETQSPYKPETMAEWHVFLVATNNYSQSTGPLKNAENDVDELAKIFSSLGVKDENLIVLKSSNKDPSTMTFATPITRKYGQFIEGLTENSIAFVYLVGHGFTDVKDGASYYAAQDFEEAYPNEARISINDMMKQLSDSKARFKWLCVDACRSEFGAETGNVEVRALDKPRGLSISQVPKGVILTQSCREGQVSMEWKGDNAPYHNGFFSRAFCDAITGRTPRADKDHDGVVTFGEIRNYLESQVAEYARLYGGGRKQNPVFTMIEDTNFDDIANLGLFKDMPMFGHHPQEYLRGQELRREAEALEKEEKYAEALDKIKESYRLLPDVPEIQTIKERIEKIVRENDNGAKAREAAKESERAFKANNFTDALRYIDQAIQLDPKNTSYTIYRKLIEEKQKNSTKPASPTPTLPIPTPQPTPIPSTPTPQPTPTLPTPTPQPGNNGGTGSTVTTSLPTGARKAGDVITIAIMGVQVNFRWCPPGEFMMGSPMSENGRFNDERLHAVKLSRGFWMAETETTQELWQAVMGSNPSAFKGNDLPVERVSWGECLAFIKRIEGYAPKGTEFALPSEEHWEYACRANSTGWDGVTASDLTGMAWYDANAGKVTHPVGRRAPNGWGLYDMHGNVSEWCADAYGDYTNAGAPKSNGSSFVSDRVRRGGGWLDGARYCRAACRGRGTPGEKSNTVGFRLELTDFSPESMIPEPQPQPVQPKVPSITEQSISPSGSRKAGTVKTISIAKVKVKFRWCPPGEFFMGSPVTEDGRYDDEILRKVRIVRGFWMAEMETTQKLWDSVMGNNPSSFRGSNLLPVECVSWDECQEFVDRIQRYAPKGMKFRLPTETHWEYACRAGTRGEYNVSDEDLYGLAYYEKNSGRKTHSVGGKIPNAWGLCDMHGNVSEWCDDAYAPYTSKSAPKNTELRVTRGGNWGSDARDCRSARRDMFPAGSVNDDIGFRVELVYASE